MGGLPSIDESECLDILSQLVQIKSYSETSGEVDATNFMAEKMREIGMQSEVFPFSTTPPRQNAVGVWKGSDSGNDNSLLFNGHLDTNPVSEGWTIDPWEGKIDKDFIYGIGVSNMKSGCAAYFCAVRTLMRSGFKPRGNVTLTYVVGELQGGVGTLALINQGHITSSSASCFINCEPSDIRAVTMHAENLVFGIELVGITRHMSAREEAVDAILAGAELVLRLRQMVFSGAKTDDHKKVNMCHIGVVRGALGRELVEWRPPQVADYCKMQGSARYAPGQTQASVIADIEASIDTMIRECAPRFDGLTFTVTPMDTPTMPAFEVDPEARIVKSLNAAYQEVRGVEQPTGVLAPTCFYGSDAGHLYKSLGMEGIVCGPGGRYNTRPDEKVDIPDYLDCVRMFMRVIVDICGSSG